VEKPHGKRPLQRTRNELGMTNTITLKHISNKQHGREGTGLVWLMMGYIVGAFEHMLILGLSKMRGIS